MFFQPYTRSEEGEVFQVQLGETWNKRTASSLATLRYERRFQKDLKMESQDYQVVGNIEFKGENDVEVNWKSPDEKDLASFSGRRTSAGLTDCALILNSDNTYTLERLDTMIINLRPESSQVLSNSNTRSTVSLESILKRKKTIEKNKEKEKDTNKKQKVSNQPNIVTKISNKKQRSKQKLARFLPGFSHLLSPGAKHR